MTTPYPIKLSIVFLNFNRIEETRHTVEMLLQMVSARSDVEIIAVDNNSEDGTAEYLQNQKGVQAILLKTNDGIAGYNEGFKKAVGEYVLVLDDDSCPADAKTLGLLITLLDKNPGTGVVACHIETPEGEPQWKWHLPHDYRFGVSPFFVGCGFAIRRELFEQIGWYPGKFFIYQNEIDVSFKVRQRGYEIYYHPDCRVIHRGIPSERPGWRCVYYPTRNTIWLIQEYYPQPMASYMLFSRILIGLGRAAYLRQLPTFWQAIRDAFAEPVSKHLLTPEIRSVTAPFWRQNSIFHQLFKWT
ncbi:MAG: glycosyltransferase [Proteobacteria bacterium]|nr:glycosyltransferase [Pseudomonadota bacterium]MBU1060699.1 glycosyltransferase [Pseudomonadota bacterium]